MTNYETVIGLEVHAELSTKTKAFCACEYSFGGKVNSQCCPGCIGLPGSLPVLNRAVVDYALKIGLATGCKINKTSKHDRKNYFYPDLAKGYQISQFDIPLCQDGHVEFYHGGEKRRVRLSRIHIEEDTAKLLHDANFKGTLIDFNRSGVALIEIVSEPDLRSAQEVKDYLEAVRVLLGTLDICNCRMQEGVIRCDINVSVRPFGQKEYGTRVEMKNINTFSGALQAVEYESARQISLLEAGESFGQETRRWDDAKGISTPMRTKEGAADYRYFPEPDLAPLMVSDEWVDEIRSSLPELPIAKYDRYHELGISEADSWLLVENPDKAEYFERCAKIGGVSQKTAVNWIVGDLAARLNKSSIPIEDSPVSPADLCGIIGMVERGTINIDSGRRVLDEMFAHGASTEKVVQSLSLAQVSDKGELEKIVKDVLEANAQSVADYKNGKANAFKYIVGQCMKASKGKGNPQIVNELLRGLLDE